MLIWEKNIPDFLIQRKNIINTVLFTAAFALVFINLYAPFGINYWFHVTKITLFFYSSLIILTGMLVVVISRIIMFYYAKKRTINYLQYSVWILAEIMSMALFYTAFVILFLDDPRENDIVLRASVRNTALTLLLPYSILWLYFSWREKDEKLKDYTDLQETGRTHALTMIPFYDEKGTLRFSIKSNELIYLEASDNYVTIRYKGNGKMSKYMLRNTLKSLEEKLRPYKILRCHRSYMVNFEFVKIIRKDKEGLRIELEYPENISLPVSKTYISQVIEYFSELQPG